MAFGPDGSLVVALASSGGVELAQVDLKEKVFRTLFAWQGERLVAVAFGPKMNGGIGQAVSADSTHPAECTLVITYDIDGRGEREIPAPTSSESSKDKQHPDQEGSGKQN
jgi:hypothetical protein